MRLINGLPAKVYHKQWRLAHPEKMKVYNKAAHSKWGKTSLLKLKQQVYGHYGAICVCCEETTPEFLSLDHINNDGAAHRRQIGRGREVIYRWIIKHNFPPSFQVLCMNCQWGKRRLGVCPHQKDVPEGIIVRGLND